ncbi:MAG: glycosyltransferase [Desulfurococcales archaeon]|nr:glycosyltransferase [Desulfurococcales archaeon]
MPGLRLGVVSTYPPVHCGVGEYTRLLLTALHGRDLGASILVMAEEGVGAGYHDADAGATVRPSFKWGDPSSLDGVLEALADAGGVDILHVQHEYGIYTTSTRILDLAAEARREGLARRIVFTLHTVYHPLAARRGETRFQEAVLSEADAVIVHSPQQEFELHAQAGGYLEKITRIPHGTMVNPYLSTPRPRLASLLGLPSSVLDGFIAVVPGFLRPDKGLDTLAEAAGMIKGRARIIVAGEPRDEGLLKLLDGAPGVRLIPRYLSTSEILMLSALSDVILLPYRDPPGKYAVSGVLHLSMGSLKPIIGTNVPRLTELYTLAPRLVFRAGDPRGLARLLDTISRAEAYELVVPYAGPLYSYAVRTSWPRMAKRHLALYRRLLG